MRPRDLCWLPALAALAACDARMPTGDAAPRASANPPAAARDVGAARSQIEPARLEQIAREFFDWGTVQEQAERAITSCKPYTIPPNGDAVASESTDDATHGGKLFLVFARFRGEYVGAQVQRAGQVIVKWSFHAVEASDSQSRAFNFQELMDPKKAATSPLRVVSREGTSIPPSHFLAARCAAGHPSRHAPPLMGIVTHDGKGWRAGDPIGLFIMARGRDDDPDSDHGWRYATTSMDGRTVYSNGLVSSCMACHASAPRDRLFGLPR